MSTVLAMHGLRGGVGVSTLLAALGHALHAQRQRVLLVDMSPDNLLGLHFNLPFDETAGWARADLAGSDWRDAAFEVNAGLTVVPYGRLDAAQARDIERQLEGAPRRWAERVEEQSSGFDWLLFDLPQRLPAHAVAIWRHARCDLPLRVLNVDSGSDALLQRPDLAMPGDARLLVNRYDPGAQLQRDLMQVWLGYYEQRLVPQPVHEDACVPEALAMKCPVGLHAGNSLAAADIDSLTVWCLAHANLGAAGGTGG